MRLIVTGFGPFHNVDENPSAWLAERSGAPFHILEVAFSFVEEFLNSLDPESFDGLLMLGVADRSDQMRVERVARNNIGPLPDAPGVQCGPAEIDPVAPQQISATLWNPDSAAIDVERLIDSVDAGDYLCNYTLYRALQIFPEKQVGFLHVVSKDTIPLDDQLAVVKKIVQSITSTEG